jgi:thiamine-monophosphate kinase
MTLERKWISLLQKHWPQVDLRQDTFFDPASRQILTTDMLVEGVHFSREYFSPQDLGWRSVAANLSDIAATGGVPLWILVSVGVPEQDETTLSFLEDMYQGIDECCRRYRCSVIGGDTVRAKETTISITAIGQLPANSQPGRRHFAKPGDLIAISGHHGLSRAGMEALQRKFHNYTPAKQAHLRPVPQLNLGQQIAKVLPRFTMMDSSDGLADAVLRIAEASTVDIVLDRKRIEIHPEIQEIAEMAEADPMDWVLYGGEDFQLVVTLPAETLGLFPQLVPVGTVHPASQGQNGKAYLRTEEKTLIPLDFEKTYQHFETKKSSRKAKQEASSS